MHSSESWHTLSAQQVVDRLDTCVDGLTTGRATERLGKWGPNELPTADRVSPWSILIGQFKNVLIIILLVATAISMFLGHVAESVVIAAIVLFATLLGFVQEYRAERAIEALRRMAAPTARVLRDGTEASIPARELVPGDVIVLRTGDKVPADARLLDAVNLQLDEASLTGESVPVEKQTARLADAHLAVADRTNLVYSGTVVSYGRGRAVVVATGAHTEFGKITGLLKSIVLTNTPLQDNLDRVGRVLGIIALTVVLLILLLGLLRGAPLLEMFIFGIALAVAVVPEALPAVVTISLALGVRRMVRRHALIRRLPIVETLGSTSVICSDKTGTLTKNEMTVREIWVDGRVIEVSGSGYTPQGQFHAGDKSLENDTVLREILCAGALASDAELIRADDRWEIRGDPTEGALVVAAAKYGIEKDALEHERPRLEEIPFTSESKRMTTLHAAAAGATVAYAKGAPEVILASCRQLQTGSGPRTLTNALARTIRDVAKAMASRALRVIAVAYKPNTNVDGAEQEMVFLGLFGMIDPPRPEVKEAIRTCEDAGIKPIMITGDHPATAEAVARELGILRVGRVVTGTELDKLPDAELDNAVAEIEVYARVSPEHKLRVIDAWQA
ncbi:MAG: HAD-IC family P-type ATPase, partial [Gammaproteobacteria bacterium]|nr:HAD-IC family P-type ATPase [Gammaproteobacteria bacterium]